MEFGWGVLEILYWGMCEKEIGSDGPGTESVPSAMDCKGRGRDLCTHRVRRSGMQKAHCFRSIKRVSSGC
eukprot:scaffold7344_cov145-Cylindrotheca_fusiformis.AAC.23